MDSEHEEAHNEETVLEEDEENRRGFIPGCLLALVAAALIAAALYLLFNQQITTYRQQVASRECFRCHAEMLAGLKKHSTHSPFAEKACTACHTEHGLKELKSVKVNPSQTLIPWAMATENSSNYYLTRFKAPKPSAKSVLLYPVSDLCTVQCHRATAAEVNQKYTMPPFANKQCLSCHDPHASDNDNLTKSPIKVLCLSCHPKIAKYYAKAVLHPPFRVGNCTSCHKAHASNFKPLLRRQPKVLCLACHPDIAKLELKAVRMQPFRMGQCPLCHNPHGSDNRRLLQAPVPTLCFRCHSKIGELQKKAVMMPPFREGKCLECHLPHGSDNVKLLQAPLSGNEICFRCHGELRANYQPIGHNRVVRNASPYQPEAGVGSCLNCHEPHASNFAGLIQKEQISLCLSCHGPRRYFAHPIGFKWDDPWRGGYLRCGSCHNPMGSGNPRLKRNNADGLCLSCHMATDPSYVYFSTGAKKWHSYQIPGSQ